MRVRLRWQFPSFALIAMLAFAGCVTTARFGERGKLECPVPPVICQPGAFDQTILDTSSSPLIRTRHYLSIVRVQGLNTEADEFGVAFPNEGDGRAGMATIRNNRAGDRRNQLLTTTFSTITNATVGTNVPTGNAFSSVGRGVAAQGTLHVAARQGGVIDGVDGISVVGDYDLFTVPTATRNQVAAARNSISAVVSWDAQPALTPDGRTLYFASTRPGGYGGADLWVSQLGSNGNWSEPKNLGPGINTPCDELSPWVSGNGRWLYFASMGHQTVGGYDLFRAPISNNQLGGVQNLGKPINTPRDEIFPSAPFTADPDTLLYYSSDQEGSRLFDVYVLHKRKRMVKGEIAEGLPPKLVRLKGTVETEQGEPVDSAIVKLEQKDPPGRKDSTRSGNDGGYEFQIEQGKDYVLTAGTDSTLFGQQEVSVPANSDSTVVVRNVVIPDTVTFRVNFPFNNATDPYEFTLDDRGLPSDQRWLDMIDRAAGFLRTITSPSANIEIVGHTDPAGSDEFNIGLGRRRAEFIRRELIKRGVPERLLTVRTEGERRPLAERANEPQDLYHARLRRVELIKR
ncbi:MAG: PD40 domain-containing protein [Armatimonadetes bacterium]|nr:PD40 domain-containing protein [Armatimonadota bacterium]